MPHRKGRKPWYRQQKVTLQAIAAVIAVAAAITQVAELIGQVLKTFFSP